MLLAIDKLTYSSNKYFIKSIDKKITNFKLDLNDRKRLFNIIKKYKPKAIFNLAAETHVDRSIDNPLTFIKSNLLGTFNLLETLRFLKKKKITTKLIHVSTDEVFGNIKKNLRSTENFKYDTSSPYSASKAGADHLVKSYVKTYGLNAVISNCCNNYGPYQFPEKLIPKIIVNIFNKKPLPIYGKGKNSKNGYVEDHCEALFTLYLRGKSGENYNIGSGKNLNNLELAKKILKTCNILKLKIEANSKIKFVKDRPGHDFRYALNSGKIKRELKWKPKINFENGLKKTINWYFNNKEFLKQFSKKTYEKRMGLKV